MTHIESSFTFPSTIFTLDTSINEPRSAENFLLQLQTPLALSKIYRDEFYSFVSRENLNLKLKKRSFCSFTRITVEIWKVTDRFSFRFVAFRLKKTNTKFERWFGQFVETSKTKKLFVCVFFRTSTRNCDVSMRTSNITGERLLQNLVEQANLSSIQTCKIIGDPRVSRDAKPNNFIFSWSNIFQGEWKNRSVWEEKRRTTKFQSWSHFSTCKSKRRIRFVRERRTFRWFRTFSWIFGWKSSFKRFSTFSRRSRHSRRSSRTLFVLHSVRKLWNYV